MTEYVCGFLFHRGQVALIRKQRPAWQKGRYNGIGGKVMPGETASQAMVREFEEETGQPTFESDWQEFVVLVHGEWLVRFYRGRHNNPQLWTTTDEVVGWFGLHTLPASILPNLSWLIPLCLDTDVVFPITIMDPSHAGRSQV